MMMGMTSNECNSRGKFLKAFWTERIFFVLVQKVVDKGQILRAVTVMKMMVVILSALLIRVSLVYQGFPGFHQRHIRILSHEVGDEEKFEDEDESVSVDKYVDVDIEDDEEGDVDDDDAGGGPGPIFLPTQV